MIERHYSSSPWEGKFSYCRARRVGPHIWIAGTVSVDEHGDIRGKGSVFEQSMFIFDIFEKTLRAFGASMRHVVRTRAYLVDISKLDEFGRAHALRFQSIDPAATGVQVSGLVLSEALIEIEADAYVPNDEA